MRAPEERHINTEKQEKTLSVLTVRIPEQQEEAIALSCHLESQQGYREKERTVSVMMKMFWK